MNPTDTLKQWMDAKKISAEEVGNHLDVSAQTVRNWRSSRVPERKEKAVSRMIEEWQSPSGTAGRFLAVSATDEQFRNWNLAANHCAGGPKLMEDWARESLDAMANLELSDERKLPAPEIVLSYTKEEVDEIIEEVFIPKTVQDHDQQKSLMVAEPTTEYIERETTGKPLKNSEGTGG